VVPVQDRYLIHRKTFGEQSPHPLDDRDGLLFLFLMDSQARLLTGWLLTDERCRGWCRDDPVRHRYDLRSGAVVPDECDGDRVGEPPGEDFDQPGFCALEAVDRLVRIADDAQAATVTEPRVQQPLLRRIGILILVDEQVRVSPPHDDGDLLVLFDEPGAPRSRSSKSSTSCSRLRFAYCRRQAATTPGAKDERRSTCRICCSYSSALSRRAAAQVISVPRSRT
jgi:hypothetical protein